MRLVIADDEPLVRAMLRDVLAGEPDVEVVAECRDGTDALQAAERLAPDALFLDVRMPGLTGLEVAARLGGPTSPLVVFVTAYDAHAVQAFELNAIDYLLKPFDPERVRSTLQRLRLRLRAREAPNEAGETASPAGPDAGLAARVESLLRAMARETPHPSASAPDRFVVSLAGRLKVIAAADVDWIEADGNYARLHTATGSALLRETMKTLEARLDPREFVRVHRSALVRLARVKELHPTPNGDYRIHLTSGAVVTMSRSYRDAVLQRLASPP